MLMKLVKISTSFINARGIDRQNEAVACLYACSGRLHGLFSRVASLFELLISLNEAVYTTFRVDNLLLASVIRVAAAANFYPYLVFG